QQAAVGTQFMALVPDVVWVTANMKETQMRDVRVGQPVEITVDALGG
ncbi:MAG TPA: hemolysin secretion protein D, partial [Brevundimonas sp.]|nr:hemolysin secretion protein D [Brevundimonas sp.]